MNSITRRQILRRLQISQSRVVRVALGYRKAFHRDRRTARCAGSHRNASFLLWIWISKRRASGRPLKSLGFLASGTGKRSSFRLNPEQAAHLPLGLRRRKFSDRIALRRNSVGWFADRAIHAWVYWDSHCEWGACGKVFLPDRRAIMV